MASLRELLNKVDGSLNETESTTSRELTVEALEALIDMVKGDALTESEITELKTSIETVFNNVMTESYDEDEYYDGDDYADTETGEYGEYVDPDAEEYPTPDFACTNPDCGWEGYAAELTEEGNCPECGSEVEEVFVSDEEPGDEVWDDEEDSEIDYSYDDEDLEESLLNKTSAHDKKASKMYKKSAAGKKSMKLNAKKRAKYATKISRCSEKGKTFSFKTMSCVKSNKRR